MPATHSGTARWPQPIVSDEWERRLRRPAVALHIAWDEFLGHLAWDAFATLTFDPKRVYPVGEEMADREAFWWCGLLGRLFRRPVGWLYAVERSPNGLWHVHALLIGVGSSVSWTAP